VENKTNKLKRKTNILLELYGIDMRKPLTTNNINPRLDACFLAQELKQDYIITSDYNDVHHFMENFDFRNSYEAGP